MNSGVLRAGEGRSVWVVGDRYTVKASGEDTGGAFALTTLTLPPYSADAPLRATARDALGYYVLSGTLVATVAERTMIVRAGSAVYVAPDTAHTCWNPTAAPAVVLLIAAAGARP